MGLPSTVVVAFLVCLLVAHVAPVCVVVKLTLLPAEASSLDSVVVGRGLLVTEFSYDTFVVGFALLGVTESSSENITDGMVLGAMVQPCTGEVVNSLVLLEIKYPYATLCLGIALLVAADALPGGVVESLVVLAAAYSSSGELAVSIVLLLEIDS